MRHITATVSSLFLLLILVLSPQTSWANSQVALLNSGKQTTFLPVDEAFGFSYEWQDQTLDLFWRVTPAHYLYQKKFAVTDSKTGQAITLTLPDGAQAEDDPTFGQVQVYRSDVAIRITLPEQVSQVDVRWQGCADAGLCYPPETRTISRDTMALNANDANQLANWLSQATLIKALAIFFVVGLGLSFTPCVLPMLPILSAIITGQKSRSARHGFLLALSYVLGMAFVFTLIGMLIAWLGARANLAVLVQKPAVLITFALLFAGFAWILASDRTLALPAFVRERLTRIQQSQQGGAYGSVFVMGAISSLVVSPCVSAPLAGILVYISMTGDVALGGMSLFSLSLGMGVPLLLIGAGGAHFLPRSGPWLNVIKQFFAWLLLALAISLIARLVSAPIEMALWIGLALVIAIWLGLQMSIPVSVRVALMALLLAYAAVLTWATARGHYDPINPWPALQADYQSPFINAGLTEGFVDVTDPALLDELIQQAKQAQRPVFVDVYADWCISCIKFEREVLHQAHIQAALAQGLLIRFDITRANKAQLDWLNREKLFGPPALLFWYKNGRSAERLLGEPTADEFLAAIQASWAE
ncbi:MAG: protein-disulfide reductase DsbD [Moraxellaceae bacterium]|nr:protein-disulfide reductase DsbD [Moraxellaceae bacterium]